MSADRKQDRERRLFLFLLFCSATFYLFFIFLDGPIWCRDSQGYVDLSPRRPYLYPLFLSGMRRLTSEQSLRNGLPAYLFYAGVVQALVNAYAAFFTAQTVYRIAGGGRREKRANTMALFALLFQFAVSLLNRFGAARGSMYAETVMSESLAMPIFSLLICHLVLALRVEFAPEAGGRRGSMRGMVLPLLFVAGDLFLLLGLRSQLVFCLPLVAFSFFVQDVWSKNRRRPLRFGILLLLLLLVFAGNGRAECLYNEKIHGFFAEHTGKHEAVLCTLLYTCSEQDAEEMTVLRDPVSEKDISGEKDSSGKGEASERTGISDVGQEKVSLLRALFVACKERGVRMADVPAGADWVETASHYADSYDIIGYDILIPTVETFVKEHPEDFHWDDQTHRMIWEKEKKTDANAKEKQDEQMRVELAYDTVSGELVKLLLHQNPRPFLRLYAYNIVKGLVCTNGRMMPALIPLCLFLYGLYFLFYLWIRKKKEREIALFAEVVFWAIAFNVVMVGAVIFPQPRYMIYSMGLFYTAGMLMVVNILEKGSGVAGGESRKARGAGRGILRGSRAGGSWKARGAGRRR
ncbi:MAG: hypothetical protein HXK81_03540 [Lachnospiraceae bacterium]|nr:hypothetical protein [Lachnospiraceae bacterium]